MLASMQVLFTVLKFQFPLLVAFLQMLVIAPVCYAVARPRLSWDITRSVLPLALVNVLNVVCGLIGELLQACCCRRSPTCGGYRTCRLQSVNSTDVWGRGLRGIAGR